MASDAVPVSDAAVPVSVGTVSVASGPVSDGTDSAPSGPVSDAVVPASVVTGAGSVLLGVGSSSAVRADVPLSAVGAAAGVLSAQEQLDTTDAARTAAASALQRRGDVMASS